MPPEMGSIHRSPRARADLVSIGDDVAERMKSLASANRVLEAIEQKLKLCERRWKTLALGRLKRLAPDVVLLL